MSPVRLLVLGPCLLLCLPAALPAQKAEHAPALVVQTAHAGELTGVAFSPDPESKLVATAGKDYTIKVWHTRTRQLLHTLTGHDDIVTSIAFSHDGKFLASTSWDLTARVWDVHTGRTVFRITWHKAKLDAVACSPRENLLACAGGTGIITLHDFGPGRDKAEVRDLRDAGGVSCLVFSPDGKILASGSHDGKFIKLWNVATGKETAKLNGHGQVRALAFSPDGKTLVSSSDDKTIRVWSVDPAKKTATEKETLKAGAEVRALAFGRPGNVLASGSEDHHIDLWDLGTGKRTTLKGIAAPIQGLAFSGDGKTLASVHGPGARLWDVDADKLTARTRGFLSGLADHVYAVALSKDGKALALGTDTGIVLWHFGRGTRVQTIRAHKTRKTGMSKVTAVAFSPDGKYLASGGGEDDNHILLWEAATGKFIHAIKAHSWEITGLAFSPDGKTLASTGDVNVHLWEVPSGKDLGAYTHKKGPFCVAFSPDGKTLAAGTYEGVLVLNAQPLKLLHTLPHEDRVYSVAFSPDGKTLVSGNQWGTIKLWDPDTGKVRRVLNPHKGSNDPHDVISRDVFALAFHPDGKVLASGSADKTVRLWDTGTFEELRTLRAHGRTVRAVAFTGDGKYLVTGSGDGHDRSNGDGAVKLWAYKEGQQPRQLCTLVAFADPPADPKKPEIHNNANSWAVVDAKGRYDATHGGEVEWLHWVIDNEPVELRQLKTQYYEPRLLPKLLGFNTEPLRTVGELKDTKLSPAATVRAVDAKKKQMTVHVDNRGGGIGRVQVLVNGKELIADARPEKSDSKAARAEITIDLSKAFLKGKDDQVEIVTWGVKDNVSSRGLVRELDPVEAPPPAKPRLHAIVVGTSKYENARLDLRFSGKDAADFARVLRLGGERHFGKDNVSVTLLNSEGDAPPAVRLPTKDNIRAAFQKAAKDARPEDVFVVFFAGHGISLRVKDDDLYCYLTAQADTMDLKAYADPAFRAARAVTSEELIDWIKQVPALQQVMVLDTCAAGAAVDKLMDVPSGQIRALERLKDRTGFHVLMGCAADRVSYESAEIQQGLLTYALLEGMKIDAAKGKTKVYSLFLHAAERVPEMAKDLKGFQEPLISSPGTRSMASKQLNFVLAQFQEGDIRLPEPGKK